jgi:uncharacterized membrane protein
MTDRAPEPGARSSTATRPPEGHRAEASPQANASIADTTRPAPAGPPGPGPREEPGPQAEKVRRTEVAISMLLRIGVVVSVAVIVAGLIVSFGRHRAYRVSSGVRDQILHGHSQFPHTIGALISGLAAGQGQALVALGLLLLLLTPIARVAVSIVAFVYQRDRTYVFIAGFVLAVLVTSFFLGKAGGG